MDSGEEEKRKGEKRKGARKKGLWGNLEKVMKQNNVEEKEDRSLYRRLSVEESILLYCCKTFCVPRHPGRVFWVFAIMTKIVYLYIDHIMIWLFGWSITCSFPLPAPSPDAQWKELEAFLQTVFFYIFLHIQNFQFIDFFEFIVLTTDGDLGAVLTKRIWGLAVISSELFLPHLHKT